jgi:excinuclease ABC subunit A
VECQEDLMKFCRIRKVRTDVPFHKLRKKWQQWVIHGDPDYGKDKAHEWPRAWYGVKGYFRWLESKAYKMHVRVLLSRYRSYTPCPECQGKRFQPEALLYQVRIADCGLRNELEVQSSAELSAPRASQSVLTLADFYQLSLRDALCFIEQVASRHELKPSDPIGLVLQEVRSRLGYLVEVGLGYLTLDRPTRSLSGGETERVNLTTCLGTRLVNTLYVLDEPSVGLHPRDTGRLNRILERLRDLGNTVVVVEHEASVIRTADQIVDLGPGHGESGGQVVFQGSFAEILESKDSLTGRYLAGTRQVEVPDRRPVKRSGDGPSAEPASQHSVPRPSLPIPSGSTSPPAEQSKNHPSPCPLPSTGGERVVSIGSGVGGSPNAAASWLRIIGATCHNLKDLTVGIPLGRFVCITGVSGSGKTTLIREVLLPALDARLTSQPADARASDRLEEATGREEEDSPSTIHSQPSTHLSGWEPLGCVVLVDQSALGKTPRSNPAVYVGAFEDIREFFAQTETARQRGLNASAFSFNSSLGQCERCRGAGFEKIEMQFLSDVFIRCPDCDGRRYRPHILEVTVEGRATKVQRQTFQEKPSALASRPSTVSWSIADLLDATVDDAIGFFSGFVDSRPARRALERLKLLQEVGLGYLRLGQPINTLSGGESQRLKLVSHLAEVVAINPDRSMMPVPSVSESAGKPDEGSASPDSRPGPPSTRADRPKPILFLFDEPTTGLHFDDVRVLLKVFQRLVDAGHSVAVIEHNLDVIKCADWLIDLGPEAGDEGGRIVAEGTPEQIAACEASHTGAALREVLRPADRPATGMPPPPR